MRQLTHTETLAMQDFCEKRDDVCFAEWTGTEYRVFRILFDGNESEGSGDTLEAAYLAGAMFPQIALPVDVSDAEAFPNIAEAIFWATRDGDAA